MEAMGQLTGGVAHDFNNLLTAVSGSLALLEPRISDERSLRLLRTAQRGASRGAKLTESLLAFARKQRLDPVAADLNSIVVDMSEMLRRSVGVSIEIRHVLATELWPVLIDVSQIETALLNVAINACDAMPRGGILLIETANIHPGSDELPTEIAGQDCVLVSLRDTGTGMSPEVIERAFEPFFTTKEIGKGTGLGLSMVFGVVRQSGGAVRIRSRLREGTTVQIYLPRATEAAALGPGPAIQLQAAVEAHILVVDDDPDVRWITAEDLREIGYVVTEADSGRAALTYLERNDPCDLAVVDLAMPGLSGLDTVRLARRTRPNLKVLFSSGYADMSKFEGDLGNEVLLRKPFGPDTLAEAATWCRCDEATNPKLRQEQLKELQRSAARPRANGATPQCDPRAAPRSARRFRRDTYELPDCGRGQFSSRPPRRRLIASRAVGQRGSRCSGKQPRCPPARQAPLGRLSIPPRRYRSTGGSRCPVPLASRTPSQRPRPRWQVPPPLRRAVSLILPLHAFAVHFVDQCRVGVSQIDQIDIIGDRALLKVGCKLG